MTYEDGYYIVKKKKSEDSMVAQRSNGDWTVRGKNITQKNIEKNYEIGFFICKSWGHVKDPSHAERLEAEFSEEEG